jgi:hypothetical protein
MDVGPRRFGVSNARVIAVLRVRNMVWPTRSAGFPPRWESPTVAGAGWERELHDSDLRPPASPTLVRGPDRGKIGIGARDSSQLAPMAARLGELSSSLYSELIRRAIEARLVRLIRGRAAFGRHQSRVATDPDDDSLGGDTCARRVALRPASDLVSYTPRSGAVYAGTFMPDRARRVSR